MTLRPRLRRAEPFIITATNPCKTSPTAIEYGLIAAGISVAIIAVVQGLGENLNTTFTKVQTALK